MQSTSTSSHQLVSIKILKEEGNKLYLEGCKDDDSALKCACAKYAEAIESIMALEDMDNSENIVDELRNTKISLFSNLAAANLKLDNYEGCRRCCNVAVLFCNKPHLNLADMGVEDDLTQDILLFEPILPSCYPILWKVLYRRGKCSAAVGQYEEAERDLSTALRCTQGGGKGLSARWEIEADLRVVTEALSRQATTGHGANGPLPTKESADEEMGDGDDEQYASDPVALETAYTTNGGPCLMRRAEWNQNTTEACVYIPLQYLDQVSSTCIAPVQQDEKVSLEDGRELADEGRTMDQQGADTGEGRPVCVPVGREKKWRVDFGAKEVRISLYGTLLIVEELEYYVLADKCIWMLEALLPQIGRGRDLPSHLVLHLTKTPPYEVFPGCEWWDRVFRDDEPIDTLTCSIGSDIGSLPAHARDRAQREHDRFSQLPTHQQERELEALSGMKKAFIEAELRTRFSAQQEDTAVAAVPERAGMLQELRQEFPHIDFTAK